MTHREIVQIDTQVTDKANRASENAAHVMTAINNDLDDLYREVREEYSDYETRRILRQCNETEKKANKAIEQAEVCQAKVQETYETLKDTVKLHEKQEEIMDNISRNLRLAALGAIQREAMGFGSCSVRFAGGRGF